MEGKKSRAKMQNFTDTGVAVVFVGKVVILETPGPARQRRKDPASGCKLLGFIAPPGDTSETALREGAMRFSLPFAALREEIANPQREPVQVNPR
jgi:hypothetical protein